MLSSQQHPVARVGPPAGHAASGHGDRAVLPDHRDRRRHRRVHGRPPRTARSRVCTRSPAEAIMALDRGALSRARQDQGAADPAASAGRDRGRAVRRRTAGSRATPGRPRPRWAGCCSTSCCRSGYPFVNKQMHKKVQAPIINDLAERYPMIVVAQTVDKLKDAGFYWATRSGVTVSMADVLVPPEKQEILDRYEERGRQDREAVPARCFEPRRAQRGAGEDLAGSHRRGR